MTVATERLEKAHDVLTKAVEDLLSGEDWAAMLATAARFHRYSANNVMLIRFQRPDATRVAGYRAWQGLGRQVRRGERGIAILAPVVYRRRPVDDTDPDAVVGVLAGFRVAHVFDVSQTEGRPLPEVPAVPISEDAPDALWDLLAAQVADAGYELHRADTAPANGVTDFVAKTVEVSEQISGAMACKTLAHELAHVNLHPAAGLGGISREQAEVEAESVAYLVTSAAGVDSGSYSFPYVALWSRGDASVVMAAAERAIRTARTILTTAGLDESTEADPAPVPGPARATTAN